MATASSEGGGRLGKQSIRRGDRRRHWRRGQAANTTDPRHLSFQGSNICVLGFIDLICSVWSDSFWRTGLKGRFSGALPKTNAEGRSGVDMALDIGHGSLDWLKLSPLYTVSSFRGSVLTQLWSRKALEREGKGMGADTVGEDRERGMMTFDGRA